jgi:hypothetical protein
VAAESQSEKVHIGLNATIPLIRSKYLVHKFFSTTRTIITCGSYGPLVRTAVLVLE